jgi:hypothetical protein
MGFALRSVPLSQGTRDVSARVNPLTVSPASATGAEAPGRPRGPRFLGFDPCESPWRPDTGLGCRPLDAPLGFTLPGRASERLDRTFARSPLTRFPKPILEPASAAPQSLNQRSPDPVRERTGQPS